MLRLFRIAIKSFRRSTWGIPPSPLLGLDAFLRSDPNLETPIEWEMQHRLAAMSVMAREVYLLRTVDRMPIDDIAQRLAIPRRAAVRYLTQAIVTLSASKLD